MSIFVILVLIAWFAFLAFMMGHDFGQRSRDCEVDAMRDLCAGYRQALDEASARVEFLEHEHEEMPVAEPAKCEVAGCDSPPFFLTMTMPERCLCHEHTKAFFATAVADALCEAGAPLFHDYAE